MASPSNGTLEARLRAAVESSPSGLLMTDREGTIVLVNRAIERLFGWPREELLGRRVEVLIPERYRSGHGGFRAAFVAGPEERAMGAGRELSGLRKDGGEVPVEIGLTPVETEEGLFVLASIVDISARKHAEATQRLLEEEVRQAQKLEAVGALAGGIAHDFNNVLFAIVGYAEMAAKARTRRQAAADLEELIRAAARGRDLVERILVFSRKGPEERRPLALGAAVAEAVKLLRVTLPPSIDVRPRIDAAAPAILADATSIHQVLVNLATNAAHAMPAGGVLEIAVEARYLPDSAVRARPGLREGPYAVLVVRDSGTGIDRTVLGRVFEPFFTTKPKGSGTGLGLATVQTIVRRHEGFIELQSQPGEGTTATCFFPALERSAEEERALEADAPAGRGERVLLVEDEPSLAQMNARRLGALGYRVTAERDPLRALALFRERPGDFDLVVTDHLMPRLLGLDLAREIHDTRPATPIVLLTGFVESLAEEATLAAGIRRVLQKPVPLRELGVAMREALAAAGG